MQQKEDDWGPGDFPMTTEQHAYVSTQAAATLTRTLDRRVSPICACGQDLDICAGEHCPRCGASIDS
jgi:hypothetical protein